MIGAILIMVPVTGFFLSVFVGLIAIVRDPSSKLSTICGWLMMSFLGWLIIIGLVIGWLAASHAGVRA